MKSLAKVSIVWITILVAGCMPSQQIDNSIAPTLHVVEVSAETTVARKNTSVPKSEILATVEKTLKTTLNRANPNGKKPVRLDVLVDSFYIADPALGILLGSSTSTITAEIKVIDVATNTQVGKSIIVGGSTEARPTIFGAAAIQSPRQELKIITESLAAKVKVSIYGE